MNRLHMNSFGAPHGFLMFIAALTFVSCGPVSIGSDKCLASSCSADTKPGALQCADGTVAAPTGACLKTADGTCAWEVPQCAPTCSPGTSKPADDGCNQCICSADGQWQCTLIGCNHPVACTESDCGAKPQSIPLTCSDGSTGGFTGKCLRDAAGTCRWEERPCPSDPGSCIFEGETYPNGSLIAANGNCCACIDGNAICRLTSSYCGNACVYDGKLYIEGETYPTPSPCNTCTCRNGENICTNDACPARETCDPAECGARPECGTYACADGSTAGCIDNCYRDDSGKCTWETRTCLEPGACTPEECGGRPKCGTYTCADGSTAGCIDNCYRTASGKCTWEIRSCPASCTPGDTQPAADGCNMCTCDTNGTWDCTDKACNISCERNGVRYAPGTGYSLGDCGNTCTCGTDGNWTCTAMACLCSYDGKLYNPGASFIAVDGCNHCTCYSDGQVGCTLMGCPEGCQEGDPGFATGECPACTIGEDASCNDDTLISAAVGKCVNHVCVCGGGFGFNPKNGKCTRVTEGAGSVCTPNLDQTCNGNLEVSSYQGRCTFDGTCVCIGNNVLDPSTGRCVRPTK